MQPGKGEALRWFPAVSTHKSCLKPDVNAWALQGPPYLALEPPWLLFLPDSPRFLTARLPSAGDASRGQCPQRRLPESPDSQSEGHWGRLHFVPLFLFCPQNCSESPLSDAACIVRLDPLPTPPCEVCTVRTVKPPPSPSSQHGAQHMESPLSRLRMSQ